MCVFNERKKEIEIKTECKGVRKNESDERRTESEINNLDYRERDMEIEKYKNWFESLI